MEVEFKKLMVDNETMQGFENYLGQQPSRLGSGKVASQVRITATSRT